MCAAAVRIRHSFFHDIVCVLSRFCARWSLVFSICANLIIFHLCKFEFPLQIGGAEQFVGFHKFLGYQRALLFFFCIGMLCIQFSLAYWMPSFIASWQVTSGILLCNRGYSGFLFPITLYACGQDSVQGIPFLNVVLVLWMPCKLMRICICTKDR